jgi:hypothetical protein
LGIDLHDELFQGLGVEGAVARSDLAGEVGVVQQGTEEKGGLSAATLPGQNFSGKGLDKPIKKWYN